jgi:hypothetical protein
MNINEIKAIIELNAKNNLLLANARYNRPVTKEALGNYSVWSEDVVTDYTDVDDYDTKRVNVTLYEALAGVDELISASKFNSLALILNNHTEPFSLYNSDSNIVIKYPKLSLWEYRVLPAIQAIYPIFFSEDEISDIEELFIENINLSLEEDISYSDDNNEE